MANLSANRRAKPWWKWFVAAAFGLALFWSAPNTVHWDRRALVLAPPAFPPGPATGHASPLGTSDPAAEVSLVLRLEDGRAIPVEDIDFARDAAALEAVVREGL